MSWPRLRVRDSDVLFAGYSPLAGSASPRFGQTPPPSHRLSCRARVCVWTHRVRVCERFTCTPFTSQCVCVCVWGGGQATPLVPPLQPAGRWLSRPAASRPPEKPAGRHQAGSWGSGGLPAGRSTAFSAERRLCRPAIPSHSRLPVHHSSQSAASPPHRPPTRKPTRIPPPHGLGQAQPPRPASARTDRIRARDPWPRPPAEGGRLPSRGRVGCARTSFRSGRSVEPGPSIPIRLGPGHGTRTRTSDPDSDGGVISSCDTPRPPPGLRVSATPRRRNVRRPAGVCRADAGCSGRAAARDVVVSMVS